MTMLALAGLIFLAIHIVPATPLRRSVTGAIGEGPYMGLFSLISLLSIFWWVRAFNGTAYDPPLWAFAAWWPWLKAAILLFAAVLFVGGLSSPNPTLPRGGKLLERPDVGQGIFAITRHPPAANLRADAAPIPAVAPVMRMVLVMLSPRIDPGSTGTQPATRRFARAHRAPAGWQRRAAARPPYAAARPPGHAWPPTHDGPRDRR